MHNNLSCALCEVSPVVGASGVVGGAEKEQQVHRRRTLTLTKPVLMNEELKKK